MTSLNVLFCPTNRYKQRFNTEKSSKSKMRNWLIGNNSIPITSLSPLITWFKTEQRPRVNESISSSTLIIHSVTKSFTKVPYLSTNLRYLYFTSVFSFHATFCFYSSTSQRETLFFLLHHIYLTALVTLHINIQRLYKIWCFVRN